MAHKSNAFPLLKTFVTFVEKKFSTCVKVLRSDNGMEFKDHSATEFYKEKGIIHQTSCVDTPQQNGVVERKHRHLLRVTRALMFQSNLPRKYWGEALLTAVYLINGMPTHTLQNRSPFEVLYKIRPNCDHLRIFGCLCYAATLKRNRDKLQSRAHPCIFLGYPYNQKAYELLDLATNKIFTSRDVRFHETIFPFQHTSISSSSETPLPVITECIPETHTFHQPDLVLPPEMPLSASEIVTMQSAGHSSSPSQSTISSLTSTSPQNTSSVTVPARRSSRSHQRPHYLKDYFCGMIHSSHLPPEHHALVSPRIKYTEFQSYEEACKE